MISVIASCSKNERAIGKNGRIPWNIPEERLYFKSITVGNAVIMGRRTFEGIGRTLPERLNIVVSGTKRFEGENLLTSKSLDGAIESAKALGFEKIFVAGGESLYREAIEIADAIFLTEVYVGVKDADTFFPDFDGRKFSLESEEEVPGNPKYVKKIYRRCKSF